MFSLHYKKIAFGLLVIFHQSIADDAATPSVTAPTSLSPCSPVPLTISGGTPPYSVSIVKADDPQGPALQSLLNVDPQTQLGLSSSITPGMSVTIQVKDSQGKTSSSGQSTVSASSNCPPSGTAGTADPNDPAALTAPPANNFSSQNGTANPTGANPPVGNLSTNGTSGPPPGVNPPNNTVPIPTNTTNAPGVNTTTANNGTAVPGPPNATTTGDNSTQLPASSNSSTILQSNTTQPPPPSNSPPPSNTVGVNRNDTNSTFKPNIPSKPPSNAPINASSEGNPSRLITLKTTGLLNQWILIPSLIILCILI